MHTWIAPQFIKRWLVVSLCCNASLTASAFTLTADRCAVSAKDHAVFSGHVIVRSAAGGIIRADELRANLHTKRLWTHSGVLLSGCGDEHPHWSICAQQAVIEHEWLSARHVTWRIGTVPLFYLPVVHIPLNSRFSLTSLFPRIGYDFSDGLTFSHKIAYRLGSSVRTVFDSEVRSARGARGHAAVSLHDAHRIDGYLGVYKGGDLEYWGKSSGRSILAEKCNFMWHLEHGSLKKVSAQFFMPWSSYDDFTVSQIEARSDLRDGSIALSLQHHGAVRAVDNAVVAIRSPLGNVMENRLSDYWGQLHLLKSVNWWNTHGVINAAIGGGLRGGVPVVRAWSDAAFHQWFLIPGGTVGLTVKPFFYTRATHHQVQVMGDVEGSLSLLSPVYSLSDYVGWQSILSYERYAGDSEYKDGRIDTVERYKRGHVLGLAHKVRFSDIADFSVLQRYGIEGGRFLDGAFFSPLLFPLTLTSCFHKEKWQLKTAHQYDWLSSQWEMHEVIGSYKNISLGIHHYSPEYAQKNELFFAGGTFVSWSAAWYHGLQLSCRYNARVMYDALYHAFTHPLHEGSITYHGHCWNVEVGYRQWACQDGVSSSTHRSGFIRVRFDWGC